MRRIRFLFLLTAGLATLFLAFLSGTANAQTPILFESQKLRAFDEGAASDRFGGSVAVSGDVAVIGAIPYADNGIGSAYVYRYDGSSWVEEQKLVASDGAADDRFGFSVAVSGNVAVIGAPYDNGRSGSAYVYRYDGTGWVEEQKLLASDGAAEDFFGDSVAVSGDVALIGASGDNSRSGSAYVYRFGGTGWVEEQKLVASDGAAEDQFGSSVAVSGDVAVIGNPYDDDNGDSSGSAYVYRYDGSSWVEEQKLQASDGVSRDRFGSSVAVSGDVAVIGAPWAPSFRRSAYVYRYNGAGWVEEQKLQGGFGVFGLSVAVSGGAAVIGAPGGSGSGLAYVFRFDGVSWVEEQRLAGGGDSFGRSVAISGHVAVIGNRADVWRPGTAYVYGYDETGWVEEQKLLGPAEGLFGQSVAVSGNVAVIGAPQDEDNGPVSGAAYVYRYDGTGWVEEQKLWASDGAEEDWFGSSVAVSGDVAVIGARCAESATPRPECAYVFRYNGTGWVEEQKLVASDGAVGRFGHRVAVSGDVAVIGAYLDDDDNNHWDSGAVYVYRYDGTSWVGEQKLLTSDATSGDRFGLSVAVSGNVVVSASGRGAGSAYVFRFDGTGWVEEQKLVASDGAPGFGSGYGKVVAVSGDVAVIGNPYDDDKGENSGSAYVYRYDGSSWVEEQKLLASDGTWGELFGYEVAVSGDLAVVGATYGNGQSWRSGSAYVYLYDGSSWVERQKLLASDGAEFDSFSDVAASGDTVLIGSNNRGDVGRFSGAAYVFKFATVRLNVSPTDALPGEAVTVEVLVDVRSNPLLAYEFDFDCDPTVLTIESIIGGETPEFSLPPTQSIEGCSATVSDFQLVHSDGPTGVVSVAKLNLRLHETAVSCHMSLLDVATGNLLNTAFKPIAWVDEDETLMVRPCIDIKPGSDPNSIPCNDLVTGADAMIPVAILTTDDFDATTVDHTTVTFDGASEVHVHPRTGEVKEHVEDVDGDGDLDRVFHFILSETDLTCSATEGTLTGETLDGQAIGGTDSLRFVLAFRGCGLGAELALLVPLVWIARRRRRSRGSRRPSSAVQPIRGASQGSPGWLEALCSNAR